MSFVWPELKRLFTTLAVLFLLITIITLVAGWFNLSIVIGMVYGLIFTTLWFVLLATIVERACIMGVVAGQKPAKRFMAINYAARYLLVGVIIVIPFLSPDKVNPYCVVISMLAPKLTYFAIGFYDTFKNGDLPLSLRSLSSRISGKLKRPHKEREMSDTKR